MSVLLAAEVDGDKLSDMQLSAFFMLLQNAGSETTRNLITTGTLALVQRPDQLRRLRADLGLLPAAIEELLRYTTPVMSFTRTATRDTEIADQAIEEGDHVLIVYASANRDERAVQPARRHRRHARAQRPRCLRRRRSPLLPRLTPRPARSQVDVRGDPHPLRRTRGRRPPGLAAPRLLEPHRRVRRDAGELVESELQKTSARSYVVRRRAERVARQERAAASRVSRLAASDEWISTAATTCSCAAACSPTGRGTSGSRTYRCPVDASPARGRT